jgi:RNA polymerase sigma-70 factor (ECF subfamily)
VSDSSAAPPNAEVLERLLASHREFLAFLEARLPDRATAEEVLQTAFVRTLDRGEPVRDPESSVAWFYRLLRNALTDYYRRRGAEARALEKQGAEAPRATEPELQAVVCSCLHRLLPTLDPTYAAILSRVDFEDASLQTVATELGITRNNATVRLHRARQALNRALEKSCGTCAEHGCLDCSCGGPSCGHEHATATGSRA